MPLLYRIVRGLIRPLLRAWCGLRHPPSDSIPASGPLVVVANHRSYLDAFLLAAAFPRPVHFIASAEAFRPGLQRLFMRRLGCIRLRRWVPDPQAIRNVLTILKAGGVVGIFPEGERSWDGSPAPILPGVPRLIALAGAPVVAVRLKGSYRLWPRWGRSLRHAAVDVEWGAPQAPGSEAEVRIALVEALATHPGAPSDRRRSAEDVGRLLWRCPSCGGINGVRGERDGRVYCLHCGARGTLLDGSHLVWSGEGPHSLRHWARRVALTVDERQRLAPPGPEPVRRWPFLRLASGSGDAPLRRRGRGEALLTPRALILRSEGWRAFVPAETIRSVTVEGSHKIQLATPDRIYELRYRRGSPRGPRAHLEAWLDSRDILYRRA